jgi:hypothetical protein
MTEQPDPIRTTQILEQAEAGFDSQAILLAGYYHKLIEQNIPDHLACILVANLQDKFVGTDNNDD